MLMLPPCGQYDSTFLAMESPPADLRVSWNHNVNAFIWKPCMHETHSHFWIVDHTTRDRVFVEASTQNTSLLLCIRKIMLIMTS